MSNYTKEIPALNRAGFSILEVYKKDDKRFYVVCGKFEPSQRNSGIDFTYAQVKDVTEHMTNFAFQQSEAVYNQAISKIFDSLPVLNLKFPDTVEYYYYGC